MSSSREKSNAPKTFAVLVLKKKKKTVVVVVGGVAMAHQHSCKLAKNTVYTWSREILPQPLGSSVVCQADRSHRKWKCK